MDDFALTAENLVIGYGERIVLHDLNFAVRPGEIFGILGNSGCGKSTLLKNLIGIFAPSRAGSRCWGRSWIPPGRRPS